jgi:hypothetical protein
MYRLRRRLERRRVTEGKVKEEKADEGEEAVMYQTEMAILLRSWSWSTPKMMEKGTRAKG